MRLLTVEERYTVRERLKNLLLDVVHTQACDFYTNCQSTLDTLELFPFDRVSIVQEEKSLSYHLHSGEYSILQSGCSYRKSYNYPILNPIELAFLRRVLEELFEIPKRRRETNKSLSSRIKSLFRREIRDNDCLTHWKVEEELGFVPIENLMSFSECDLKPPNEQECSWYYSLMFDRCFQEHPELKQQYLDLVNREITIVMRRKRE